MNTHVIAASLAAALVLLNASLPVAVQGQSAGQPYPQGATPQPYAVPSYPIPGMVNPGQNPAPNSAFGGWGSNGSPQLAPNFWQTFATNRVNTGTVLTGTMQDTLSSKNAKVGDVFAIVIDQGYFFQDKPIIPPGSKILGSVTAATAAKSIRNGAPGNVSVAIQTIVFPDGRTAPISAFIEYNPNQTATTEQVAGKKGQPINHDIPLASYANSIKGMGYGMVGSVSRMFGVRYSPRTAIHAGSDFSIEKGQQLGVRLNRAFDLSSLTAPIAPTWGNAGANSTMPATGTPGLAAPGNSPPIAPSFSSPASTPAQNEPF